MIIMCDSITPDAIPDTISLPIGTFLVSLRAGYVNGRYAWSTPPQVTIDVAGNRPDADVLDVETGDATPAVAVTWVQAKLAMQPTYPPTIYCNRDTQAAVNELMANARLALGSDYMFWVATLDGTTELENMSGVAAIQAYGSNQLGINVDASLVYDPAFPGGDGLSATDVAQLSAQIAQLATQVNNLQASINTLGGWYLGRDPTHPFYLQANVEAIQGTVATTSEGVSGITAKLAESGPPAQLVVAGGQITVAPAAPGGEAT